MSVYTITPLVVGILTDYEKSWLLFNTGCGERVSALITCFLIRGGGRTILVDTGCCDPGTAALHAHAPLEQTPDMELLRALNRAGTAAADVDCIVHTHLHWDHCYNDGLFPDCKIYVQQREVQYAVSPLPFQWDEYETAHMGHAYPWLPEMHRFALVSGDLALFPGIDLVLLPGHSRGFQGVLVQTEAGREMIAGDSLPLYDNWLGAGKRRIPSTVHVDTRDCLASFDRMAQLSDFLWAGRDPRILDGVRVRINHREEGEDVLAHL